VVVDGNDNVWISNFVSPNSPITQLCGVRTENCPPGFKTGDQISPPGGYVGGGLQMQTDIAISPSGDVWVMNNWQTSIAASAAKTRRFQHAAAAKGWWSSSAWPSRCVRRRSGRRTATTDKPASSHCLECPLLTQSGP
jgi:hypothetical protein